MEGMDPDIHLLVHAGAPSNRKDDEHFIQQARAYSSLDFESTDSATTKPPSAGRFSVIRLVEYEVGNKGLDGPHSAAADVSSFIEDTQLAHTALESQLSISHLVAQGLNPDSERRRSKRVHKPTKGAPNLSDACESRESPKRAAPQSQPSQSSYLVTPVLDRKSEVYRIPSDVSPLSDIRTGEQDTPNPSTGTRFAASEVGSEVARAATDAKSAEDTLSTNETTSELPTSYSLSDVTSENLKESAQVSRRSPSDPTPTPVQANDDSCPDVVPGKRTFSQSLHLPVKAGRVGLRSVAHRDEEHPQNPTSGIPAVFASLATSIYPPQPKVSTGRFETHVTDALRQLDAMPHIADRYKPTSIFRDIELLERGHWLVQCSSWTIDQQVGLWETLAQLIESGSAGWGVWCSRGQEAGGDSCVGARDVDANASTADELGPVRVYCWGEIAKHIYLLLYVASSSQVRRAGLQWIDSQGLVVIQMRGATT